MGGLIEISAPADTLVDAVHSLKPMGLPITERQNLTPVPSRNFIITRDWGVVEVCICLDDPTESIASVVFATWNPFRWMASSRLAVDVAAMIRAYVSTAEGHESSL